MCENRKQNETTKERKTKPCYAQITFLVCSLPQSSSCWGWQLASALQPGPGYDRKPKPGISGGDTAFDLGTVDGQIGFVRLAAYGLLTAIPANGETEIDQGAYLFAYDMLVSVCALCALAVLIECSRFGYCYEVPPAVDPRLSVVYDTGSGNDPSPVA